MPDTVRGSLESAFGYDLSPVRIHQDSVADSMGARAVAQGANLHFGAGEYAPHTSRGFELLAHEVAHVCQQAMGRAPSGKAKFHELFVNDPLEAEADTMAARATRGETIWAGGGTLRALPSLGGPMLPKLKVSGHWIEEADHIATRVIENGGDAQIVRILQRWAADDVENGRNFTSWANAIKAAGRERGPSWLKIILVLFLIFLLIVTMGGGALFLYRHNQYEARSGMQGTAHVARRPLEPLMQPGVQQQIVTLAAQTATKELRAKTRQLPIKQILDSNPTIEMLLPQASQLRDVQDDLEQLAPQLERLAPVLQQVQPVLDQLGPNELANPARTGVYHEHVFLGPRPQQSELPAPFGVSGGMEQSPVSPPDLGFFHEGVRPERKDLMHTYGEPTHHYDRDLMEKAALAVARDFGKYKGLTLNCQDYADAVVTAYKELGGKEIVPTQRSAVILALTDMVIDVGGLLLDYGIDQAVAMELAALPQSSQPSECAWVVAHKLGVSPDTFSGAIDEVLNQQIDVPSLGERRTIRDLLCERPKTRDALLDLAMDQADAQLDKPVTLPEEGATTLRTALCAKKGSGGENVLQGVVFEIARIKGGAKIAEAVPGFIADEPLAKKKLISDLTRRLANNLYQRLNLQGLCG